MNCLRALAPALASLVLAGTLLPAQKAASLSEEEEDKLREVQDPAVRIEVYLAFEQARLDRIDGLTENSPAAASDKKTNVESLLSEYIALNDELKNWIDFQYQRRGDMRHGLRVLVERGPQQLDRLRRIQQSPDAHSVQYADSLRDAIDNLSDTLDGATKALSEQEKLFGQLKREEKSEARASKERAKEERKRTKEEKKFRKREHRKGVPAGAEEN